MKRTRKELTRRRFLGILATTTAFSHLGLRFACGSTKVPLAKTILSFYCDDTSPYAAGVEAFGTFLEFCADHRLHPGSCGVFMRA